MNALLYELIIFSNPEAKLSVKAFQGKNLGISQHYQYDIFINIDNHHLLSSWIGERAVLLIEKQTIHGIITTTIDHAKEQEAFHQIRLESPLAILKFSQRNKIYLDKNASQILEELLTLNGFERFQYHMTSDPHETPRSYTNQHNQTDFDFFHQQCAHYGLLYCFEQTKDYAKLIMHHDIQKLSKSKITLQAFAPSGHEQTLPSVQHFEERFSLLTDHGILKDYDEENPLLSLHIENEKQSDFKSHGIQYSYGTHYQTIQQGSHHAKIRQNNLEHRRHQIIIQTDDSNIQAGTLIQYIDHHNPENNGDYIALSIQSSVDVHTQPHYQADILLQSFHKPYHMNPNDYPKPLQSNLNGQVFGEQIHYSDLDDRGYYQVHLPHAHQVSHRIRLSQPYVGNNYGFHFPLHRDTEVLLTHINGDPDRPVILGALKNHYSKSPVTISNASQNILRTWGMNELLIDDEKAKIQWQTKDAALFITLAHQPLGIQINSVHGGISYQSNRDHIVYTKSMYEMHIGNSYQTEVKNQFSLETKIGSISQQSEQDIRLTTSKNFSLIADSAKLSGQQIIFEAGIQSTLLAQQDISFSASNGTLKIKSHNNMIFSSEHIIIENGTQKIEITPDGNILIQGSVIHLMGSNL